MRLLQAGILTYPFLQCAPSQRLDFSDLLRKDADNRQGIYSSGYCQRIFTVFPALLLLQGDFKSVANLMRIYEKAISVNEKIVILRYEHINRPHNSKQHTH